MRQSISIIQPSLFEGWSTIVEEARSIGKNIILSDLEVHKEQNYSNSIFFKRNSYKDLAKKIEKVLENCKSGPDLFTEKNFSAKNSKLMKDFVYNFIKLSNSI